MASAQTSKSTRKPLDFYPTPPFYVRGLLKYFKPEPGFNVLYPFVGDGAIPEEIGKHVPLVKHSNDIHYYGYSLDSRISLFNPENVKLLPKADYIIDNPPYDLISNIDLVDALYNHCDKALCLLLRQTWYSAGTGQRGVSYRGRWLSEHPASMRITLPRYPFANNSKTGRPQTDACAHEWVIWDKTGKIHPVQNPVVTSENLEGWQWR